MLVAVNQNTLDKPKQLRRVWGLFYLVGLMFLSIVLLMPFLAIYDYWRATNRGELRPEGIEWQLVLSVTAAFFLAFCFPMFEVWAELKIEFTEFGISRRSLLGKKFIRWSDINRIEVYSHYVELKSVNQTLKLNTLYYKDRATFFQLIVESVPRYAEWYMTKDMWAALDKDRPRQR